MTKIYTTEDYFRDNFWFFDLFFDFTVKLKISLHRLTKSIANYDLESHVFRIIENLPYGLAIFFLGFLLVIAILRATEAQNGVVVTSIYTNSMSPKIMPGSLVFTAPKLSYRLNDIVSYKERNSRTDEYTGRVLMHRIVEVKTSEDNSRKFIAKGDNNENPDASLVNSKDVIGNVRLIIPYFGYVDFLTKTIPGFLMFIVAPAILLIVEAKRYLYSD